MGFGWIKSFNVAMTLIPAIGGLVAQAEEAGRDGNWTSTEKKDFVMQGIKSAVSTMAAISTGGQLATWDRIAPRIDAIVDNLVAIMFPHE